MRDTFYQSVGNPIQYDRLPKTQPAMNFLSPNLKLPVMAAQVATSLAVAAGFGLAAMILHHAIGVTWLEPFDLLFAIPVIIAGIVIAVFAKQIRWLLHPVFLAGIGILCLNHRTPWLIHVASASGIFALMVYAIGCHWNAVRTANPMPFTTGQSVRREQHRQLLLVAGFAAFVIAISLSLDSPFLAWAVMAAPLTVAIAPFSKNLRRSRWRVACDALASWFTYDAQSIPGLLKSPVGPSTHRRALTILATVLTAITFMRWADSPVPQVINITRQQHEMVMTELNAQHAGPFEQLRYGGLTWGLAFIAVASLPVVVPMVLATSFAMPVMLDTEMEREKAKGDTNGVATVIKDLRRSPDMVERDSVYLGRVVADGSPVLVPRSVFRQHAHGLGDSGGGKTSLFLCPIIEQLASNGDCSVIVLDLKADSLELLASQQSAIEVAKREWSKRLPVKVFSNQFDRPTFAFNPMTQPFWSKLDRLTQTDILCGATGLTYGSDYGEGFYSSANAANVYYALKTFPHIRTFKELATGLGHVILSAKKHELNPEIRRAGVHVHEVMKRLAACQPLNVTESTGHDPAVVDEAIDLMQVFQQPQMLYFHLSATLSPSCAPEIARLVNYMLLAAATKSVRRHPVYLVIDEFQRMVAANLEYMLQLARSLGVGVILANQSMEDLKKSRTNLIPAIEANCRLRQWFAVSCSEDQERLCKSSGLTVDIIRGRTVTTSSEGKQSISRTETEKIVNRIEQQEVLLTTDHPFRSFLRISRGDGYAQYGGMPVIIESGYHITEREYSLRKAMPWPDLPGMFLPDPNWDNESPANVWPMPTSSDDPIWSEDIIGNDNSHLLQADRESMQDLFTQFEGMKPEE